MLVFVKVYPLSASLMHFISHKITPLKSLLPMDLRGVKIVVLEEVNPCFITSSVCFVVPEGGLNLADVDFT